jgi:hypothetical protein
MQKANIAFNSNDKSWLQYLCFQLLIIGAVAFTSSWLGIFHLLNITLFRIYAICAALIILILLVAKPLTFLFAINQKKKLIALIFIPLALSCFAPPFDWDEVAYNLGLPEQYLSLGYFKYINDYVFYSAFPLFSDAFNTTLLKASNYILPHILGAWAYLSLGLITYLFCKLLNIRILFTYLAITLVLCSPSIYSLAPTSKPDNLIALYILTSIFSIIYSTKTQDKKIQKKAELLSIFLISFAIGFKYSALYLIPAYASIVIYVFSYKKQGQFFKNIIWFAIKGFLIFFAINSVWLIRNYIETGNPIYPLLSNIFPDNLEYHFTPYRSMLVKEFLNSMINMSFMQSFSILVFLKNIKGQAFLIPYIFFPVVAIKFLKKNYIQNLIFILVIATLITLVELFFFLPWETRHIVTINILIFIVFAYFLNSIITIQINSHISFLAYIVFTLLFLSKSFILVKNYPFTCFSLNLNKSLDCGSQKATFGKVAIYLNSTLKETDRVALNIQPFFYLKKSYLFIFPWMEKPNLLDSDEPTDMLAKLKSENITHIAWWKQGYSYSSWFDPAKGSNLIRWFTNTENNIYLLEKRGFIKEITVVDGITIYRLQ